MREFIEKIMEEYVAARQEPFTGHPMGTYFRNDIPNVIYNTGIVKPINHLITGSVGQGNWAAVPWVCIFDRNITTSATKGVYIVYLLSKDGQTLYLTFNQGCTDIRNENSKRDTIKIMREKAAEIVSRIDSRGFRSDEDINLGNGLTGNPALYQHGTIFYKAYHKGAVPREEELQSDLVKMMEIYADYVASTQSAIESGHKNTWLLTWNPNNWTWSDFETAVSKTHKGTSYQAMWSCINTHVKPGDRVYLSLLGLKEANGIIASGYATSEVFEAEHWDERKRKQGRKTNHIEVNFEWIIDYNTDKILRQEVLRQLFPNQQWSPQGSGIQIQKEYVSQLEREWEKLRVSGEGLTMPVKDIIAHIKNYVAAKGFRYEDGLIENFYLSLKSKPFVILAGTSGTGKTRLVKLFAEAVGATTANGRYKMVSVRPDWSDSSDLFGHVDLNGRFIPGAIIDFVKKAEIDSNYPYFLCLDEMNLARVEYYLSDVLSVIETRAFVGATIQSDPLVSDTYFGADLAVAGRYGTVRLPENLYIVGTVNMDETTFPFSRKVLDRANTIEFSYVDLMPNFDELPREIPRAMNLSNAFLKTEYLLLGQCVSESEAVNRYCLELQKINRVLQKAGAHVGYRVRDEIVFYLLNNKKHDLLAEKTALDNELMQKILPRIQGSSASVKAMLCELFKLCAGDYDGYQAQSDNVSDKMKKALNDADREIKYRHSAEKIELMTRRFEEDGFTSYWL